MVNTTYKNGDVGDGLWCLWHCFTMFYPQTLKINSRFDSIHLPGQFAQLMRRTQLRASISAVKSTSTRTTSWRGWASKLFCFGVITSPGMLGYIRLYIDQLYIYIIIWYMNTQFLDAICEKQARTTSAPRAHACINGVQPWRKKETLAVNGCKSANAKRLTHLEILRIGIKAQIQQAFPYHRPIGVGLYPM